MTMHSACCFFLFPCRKQVHRKTCCKGSNYRVIFQRIRAKKGFSLRVVCEGHSQVPAEVQVLCAQTTSARSEAYTGPDEECMCCTYIKYRLTTSLSLRLSLRGLIFQLSLYVFPPVAWQ